MSTVPPQRAPAKGTWIYGEAEVRSYVICSRLGAGGATISSHSNVVRFVFLR